MTDLEKEQTLDFLTNSIEFAVRVRKILLVAADGCDMMTEAFICTIIGTAGLMTLKKAGYLEMDSHDNLYGSIYKWADMRRIENED